MSEYETIATLENEVEARLLSDILTEREIPHALISYHDFAYNGLFQMQKGWGRIEGPKTRREEIVEILRSLREENADKSGDS
ncbi:hypothetical protein HQ520_10520 [bacterium]|nr:hypothetical protein [bacterium]